METKVSDIVFASRMASSPIIILQLILSCFADKVIVKPNNEKVFQMNNL